MTDPDPKTDTREALRLQNGIPRRSTMASAFILMLVGGSSDCM
jgi:hypothetical protein